MPNRKSGGCKCCPSTPGTCSTYAVQVLDTFGNPVPGIVVSLQRRTGSAGPTGGTLNPVVGSTDADGLFSYTIPGSPLQYINGGSATIPMGGPEVSNTSATVVGSTCTYRFRLCRVSNVTTTLDGDTGAPVSGVTLGGGFCGRVFDPQPAGSTISGSNCQPPSGGYPPWWIVAGADHTRYAFTMSPVNATGIVGGGVNYGAYGGASSGGIIIGGGQTCKEGYWGDIGPGAATPCGTQSTSTVYLWKRDKFLLNPAAQAFNSRRTVLERKICVSFVAPTVVTGQNSYTVAWDPTSWDGDPCAPNIKGIRYRQVFGPGSATGSCQCDVYDEAVDVAYDGVVVEVIIYKANNIWNIQAGATPFWNTPVPCGCPIDSTKKAGPHLECRRTLTDGTGRQVYDFQMPANIVASGPGWVGTGGGGQADIYGGHSQTASVMVGSSQFRWGCPPGTGPGATVQVSDGGCGGSSGLVANLASEDDIDLADEDGIQLEME